MEEPISERAHYVVAADTPGRADFLLFQDGRVQASGLLPIIWRQGGSGAATDASHALHGILPAHWWRLFRAVA
jgi:hypothetical protein